MAQWLRAQATIPEDLGLVPNTHPAAHINRNGLIYKGYLKMSLSYQLSFHNQ